jgi:hypothetical protein
MILGSFIFSQLLKQVLYVRQCESDLETIEEK